MMMVTIPVIIIIRIGDNIDDDSAHYGGVSVTMVTMIVIWFNRDYGGNHLLHAAYKSCVILMVIIIVPMVTAMNGPIA